MLQADQTDTDCFFASTAFWAGFISVRFCPLYSRIFSDLVEAIVRETVTLKNSRVSQIGDDPINFWSAGFFSYCSSRIGKGGDRWS